MASLKLSSCLASQIQGFINIRQLSGTDYKSQAQLLGYFDRFLVEQGLSGPRITRELTNKYQQSLQNLSPRVQCNRFCVVRQLCKYLARTDPDSYVPEALRAVPSSGAHRPYIYCDREIQALLGAASRLPPPGSLRPVTYNTLLGLLYTTGIRIGEALALNLDDYNEKEQRLYIAKGKFRKARWVPLSVSTNGALEEYLNMRLRSRPPSSDCPLFLNQGSKRLSYSSVDRTFHKLLLQCDITQNKGTAPRLHDLRHTFAVHRLLAWYQDGEDINCRLPLLATFMGHVDVSSTHVYLRPTAELLEEVNKRFHSHFLINVNPKGKEQ